MYAQACPICKYFIVVIQIPALGKNLQHQSWKFGKGKGGQGFWCLTWRRGGVGGQPKVLKKIY